MYDNGIVIRVDAVTGKEKTFKRLSQKETTDILSLIETTKSFIIPDETIEKTPIKVFDENNVELELKREYKDNETKEAMKLYKYLESKGVL